MHEVDASLKDSSVTVSADLLANHGELWANPEAPFTSILNDEACTRMFKDAQRIKQPDEAVSSIKVNLILFIANNAVDLKKKEATGQGFPPKVLEETWEAFVKRLDKQTFGNISVANGIIDQIQTEQRTAFTTMDELV